MNTTNSEPIAIDGNADKFVPLGLLQFDTTEQKFSMLGYFRVWWKDELLAWNPSQFATTYSVKIPTTEMWTPSLIILKVRSRSK